jgi:hypothetical protein
MSKPVAAAEAASQPNTPPKAQRRRTPRLASAVADGSVALYLLRSSGRTRHVPYVPKSERPAVAALRTAAAASTMPTVAAEHETSVSTLRRRLLALAVSEDVDAGKFDALWDGQADRVQFTRGGAE